MHEDDHVVSHLGNVDDTEYDRWIARMNERFAQNTELGVEPLFTTDADGLWRSYLDSFPDATVRQYHNCHACRHFIERVGGLVTINAEGLTSSACWHVDDAPELYQPAVMAMARLMRRAKVTGVFLSELKVFGQPVTGIWHHSYLHSLSVFSSLTQTAGQRMAEKHEDFLTVMRALQDFPVEVLDQALKLLQTESLYQSEKVLGPVQWLRDLYVRAIIEGKGGSRRGNIIWKAVATAPAGFCHPRSSMAGTLLEDIAAGMDFPEVSRRFAAKMHPLQYQRPQAAPAAGTITQAEKIVEQMGIAPALKRRFARLDEIQAIWRPKAIKPEPTRDGVFGHLRPKVSGPHVRDMDIPPQVMTWEKFAKTVLPTADAMTWYVNARDHYTAILTAVVPDAPMIFQWGHPFSWYMWHMGSPASQWQLTSHAWAPVSAITLKPCQWSGEYAHLGKGVIIVLRDARETRIHGSALFPECLVSELHGVRAVIEAFSKAGTIEGINDATACGVMLSGNGTWKARLKVQSGTSTQEYHLDRFD